MSDLNDVRQEGRTCSFSQKSIQVSEQLHYWVVYAEVRLDEVEEGYKRSDFALILQ